MNLLRRGLPEDLRQKIYLDNLFRLAVSLTSFAIAIYLWMFHVITAIHPLCALLLAYTGPYLLAWWLCPRIKQLRALDYLLSAFDIAAIAMCIHFTGGSRSPFFYLYAIPFLVQAFHFDFGQIKMVGLLSSLSYVILLHHAGGLTRADIASLTGQWVFLTIVILTAVVTVRLLRKKEEALQKSVQAMESNVQFLNDLNALALELP